MAAVKDFFPFKILDWNNRESSEESKSGEDSGGDGLSREIDSADGGAENELHIKIIWFMVNSL